ncbi:MAG: MBL fold metallo-hydrolase, partial [Aquificota bacterium]
MPSFAVGRTQEVLYILNKAYNEGRIPHISVYLDSPLAIAATEIFQH